MPKVTNLSLLALLFLCLSVTAHAQVATGTILGVVRDNTGAVIPNATITITNKATNIARTISSNAEGLYNAPALQPGDYEVRAEVQGFRTVVRDALVTAGNNTTVDLSMQLGETREVVTVEAATGQVNYESNTIQGVINRSNIQDLPLNGRSAEQLASLEPGVTVVSGSTSQFNAMFNVSVFGTSAGATAGSGVGTLVTVDGGIVNDEMEGGTSMNLSQEVVQEFQLSTVNFDLSTFMAASGALNIVTRSGSNDLHGSAYFFFRDHNMAAYPGLQRSKLFPDPFFARRNPGFWLGGPIKKDKLFFFFNYEHLSQTSVLTEQQDLASLQPLNAIFPSPYHYNLITARLDYHLSNRHTLFARFSHDGNQGFGQYFGTPQPAQWNFNNNWSDQSIMGVTSVLTPALVNDFRFQYHYWQNNVTDATPDTCQFPCIGFGLPSIVSFLGSGTFGTGVSVNSPQFRQARSFEWTDSINWQKGKHRIRFGMDYENMRTKVVPWDYCDPGCLYVESPEFIQGILGSATSAVFPNLPKTITSTNDLLNLPVFNLPASLYSGVGIGNGTFPGFYQHDRGGVNQRLHPYVADSWKVRDNLTLNFGLAYDLETGLFYSDLPLPQYLAPILQGQTGGVPAGLGATQPNTTDFSPSVGFAWAVDKSRKTVIRGGAGIYWDTQPIWQHFREGAAIGPVGDGRTTLAASAFTNIFPDVKVVAAGLPSLPVGAALPINTVTTMTLGQFMQIMQQQLPALEQRLTPTPPASGPYSVTGIDISKQGVELYPSHFPLLRSYQTSIGVQRELGTDMVISVDWARRQAENTNLGEQDLNRYGRFINGVRTPVIPVCTPAQYYQPGQECSTGGITFWTPEGRSVYDGLLVKLQKRFSHRYQFVASYAFQKNLGMTVVNLDNFFAGYGETLARHNLNVAGTVNLPWGFTFSLNSSIISPTPITPTLPGSVDLNGAGNTTFPITEAAPGLPYNCFGAGCGKSDLAKAVAYFNANYAGKRDAKGSTIPSVVLPSDYQFADPVISQDVRLTKEFAFGEKYRFSVFGEFFNVLNIANLTGYSRTLDSAVPATRTQTFAFGQPTARVGQVFGSGGPRAIQIGGRFTF